MMSSAAESYLQRLGKALAHLPADQRRDILAEIGSHIEDAREGEDVTEVLSRLGSPREIAALYDAPRAPHRVRLAVEGLLAMAVMAGSGMLAAIFLICAVAKPLNPEWVGLFQLPPDEFSLHLGFQAAPAGTELLGWWIVPLGLVTASLLSLLAAKCALWMNHRLAGF